ncbi:CDP-glycerol glycerophosphotransferase family protein [Pseudoalteromonas sp.]|uniref:CDP-glycerol glycerophosphotransferase family protein n=1 Tax=Pseudoalteromonas sp. TaxID=53249 RepID=UPI0035652F9B
MNKRYLMFVMQPYSYAILRPLQSAILARGDEVAWFLSGNDVNAASLTEQEHYLSTIEQVKAYNPDAVFVPGNVVPDFIPGAKVQVFHGLEYKKKGHFAIRGFFDLYCTHGPLTTEPFQQLAKKHGYFSVVETGWPKLDPYFDYAKCINDKPVILYAPTFSPSLSSLPHLFEQITLLAQSNKFKIVIKFHSKTKTEWQQLYRSYNNDNLIIDNGDNLIPLIQQADIVISDTSSAVDEALLIGKPVVTFNNSSPQAALINIDNPSELNIAIDKALKLSDGQREVIDNYIKQVHPFQDGKSAERILQAVDELLIRGVKRKPLNLIRKYKIRKLMKYYKLG